MILNQKKNKKKSRMACCQTKLLTRKSLHNIIMQKEPAKIVVLHMFAWMQHSDNKTEKITE